MTEAQELFYAQGTVGLAIGYVTALLVCLVLGMATVRALW